MFHRGVSMPTTMCGACNNDEETCDHILISCPMAKEIMDSILNWCGIGCEKFSSVKYMLCFISRWSGNKKKQSLLNMILCGTLWCIWVGRNKRIFENVYMKSTMIVERINVLSFIWSKHRTSFKKIDWRVWNICPFHCLKLNEIVNVEVDGKSFTVGVVEYEDDPWFPFKFDDEREPYESQSDVNSSSDEEYEGEHIKDFSDGVQVDKAMNGNEVEEGEIVAEEFDVPPTPPPPLPRDDVLMDADGSVVAESLRDCITENESSLETMDSE
uniref:Reverse transcriptase zinc-binding domain-containing protein n=1 Tax=Lactuca sativa TaxID=4236 RepID=A0A9R1VNX9_LACSA|nr:hypothetical protein LSAT_V11C500256110 [Lactuca sativa]